MGYPLDIKTVAVTELSLDLRNYRMPIHATDENEAILYLIQNEKVFELASEILKAGYLDNEIPLVTSTDTGYTVLEGNRRVTVLKLLNNPALAHRFGDKIATQYDRLVTKYKSELADIPSHIRVMVSESADELQPHIARLHTQTAKKQWSTEQQAQFYYVQIESGSTVADLKSRYNLKSRLNRLLQAGSFFALVDALRGRLTEEEVKLLASVKASPLEYALRLEEIRQLTGLKCTKEGLFAPCGTTPKEMADRLTDDQLVILVRLAQLMKEGEPPLNTRHPIHKGDEKARSEVLSFLSNGDTPPINKEQDQGHQDNCAKKSSPESEPFSRPKSETSNNHSPKSPGESSQPSVDATLDSDVFKNGNISLKNALRKNLKDGSHNDDNQLGVKYVHPTFTINESVEFEHVNGLLYGVFTYGNLPANQTNRRAKLYLITPALRSLFELTLSALDLSNIPDMKLPSRPHSNHKQNVDYVVEKLSDNSFLTYVSKQFPEFGGYKKLKSTFDACNFSEAAGTYGNLAAHASYQNLTGQHVISAFNAAVLFAFLSQWHADYKTK